MSSVVMIHQHKNDEGKRALVADVHVIFSLLESIQNWRTDLIPGYMFAGKPVSTPRPRQSSV